MCTYSVWCLNWFELDKNSNEFRELSEIWNNVVIVVIWFELDTNSNGLGKHGEMTHYCYCNHLAWTGLIWFQTNSANLVRYNNSCFWIELQERLFLHQHVFFPKGSISGTCPMTSCLVRTFCPGGWWWRRSCCAWSLQIYLVQIHVHRTELSRSGGTEDSLDFFVTNPLAVLDPALAFYNSLGIPMAELQKTRVL